MDGLGPEPPSLSFHTCHLESGFESSRIPSWLIISVALYSQDEFEKCFRGEESILRRFFSLMPAFPLSGDVDSLVSRAKTATTLLDMKCLQEYRINQRFQEFLRMNGIESMLVPRETLKGLFPNLFPERIEQIFESGRN